MFSPKTFEFVSLMSFPDKTLRHLLNFLIVIRLPLSRNNGLVHNKCRETCKKSIVTDKIRLRKPQKR